MSVGVKMYPSVYEALKAVTPNLKINIPEETLVRIQVKYGVLKPCTPEQPAECVGKVAEVYEEGVEE